MFGHHYEQNAQIFDVILYKFLAITKSQIHNENIVNSASLIIAQIDFTTIFCMKWQNSPY